MKIGQPGPAVQEQASATPAAASARKHSQEQTAAAAGSAKVEISSATASLLTRAPGAPAEIDRAKVERIAQAIADGSFKVNAEAIADKLIANACEVLGRVKS